MIIKIRLTKKNPLWLLILLFSTGCEEVLPLRDDPANFVTTYVRTFYTYNTPIENRFYVFIGVKNNYDETLEAKAAIDATLRIQWQAPEGYTVGFINEKNIKLRENDIFTGKNHYNASTGMITLNPGDSLEVGYRWDFITDDKTDMLLLFQYRDDRNCLVKGYPDGKIAFRRISEKQTFNITASVKLFEKSAILNVPPLRLKQCVGARDFGPWDPQSAPCLPILNDPCAFIQ